MANTLLTISSITNRALPVLANELVFVDKVNRQYDKEFGQKGYKIGGTANVRLPPRYLGTFGPALNVEPSTETYVPVSVLYQYHVDVQFNTINMLLDIDEFEDRFIHPACITVANTLDSFGAYFFYQNTAQSQGTPGTAVSTFLPFANARAVLASEGMPKGMTPSAILHPMQHASMADAFKGQYNPQASISEFWETGMIVAKTAGADWFEDPNVPNYTTGTLSGTPVVNSTPGSAYLTSGWAQFGTLTLSGLSNTTGSCYVGDTIQIANVYPVNPQNRVRYGAVLKQFVVLPPGGYAPMVGSYTPGGPQFAAAALTNGTFNAATGLYTSSGTGVLDLTIGECVITGGQFQNCVLTTGQTLNGQAVTINGQASTGTSTASTENAYFHRDAMAMAVVDLPLPRTAVEASRAYDEDLGISIRVATQYTINNDAEPTRMDIAWGFGSLYRTMGVRVRG